MMTNTELRFSTSRGQHSAFALRQRQGPQVSVYIYKTDFMNGIKSLTKKEANN